MSLEIDTAVALALVALVKTGLIIWWNQSRKRTSAKKGKSGRRTPA